MTLIGPLVRRHLEEGHRARLQDTGFARGRESERSLDIRVPCSSVPPLGAWCRASPFLKSHDLPYRTDARLSG